MLPSRVKIHFKQAVIISFCQQFVVKHSFLRPVGRRAADIRFVIAFPRCQIVNQRIFRSWRQISWDCPICFFHFPILKNLVHPRQRFACFGEYDKPAHRAVKPVNHATKHIAWLVIFFAQIIFDHLRQWFVACFIALHDFTCGFIHHYQMIIFINNLHRLSCPFQK